MQQSETQENSILPKKGTHLDAKKITELTQQLNLKSECVLQQIYTKEIPSETTSVETLAEDAYEISLLDPSLIHNIDALCSVMELDSNEVMFNISENHETLREGAELLSLVNSYMYNLILQAIQPKKHVVILGREISCFDDYMEYLELWKKAATTAEVPKAKLTYDYLAYVSACQMRKAAIADVRKKISDKKLERRKLLLQIDTEISNLQLELNDAQNIPVPNKEDYRI